MVGGAWHYDSSVELLAALWVALGVLAVLSVVGLLTVRVFALAARRAERWQGQGRDLALLRLGEARGRQEVLDEVRMLEHGQLKAHVLAVQHCLIQACHAGSPAECTRLLDDGLVQTHHLLEVVVSLHQAVSDSALPDDLEQTVVDVVRSLGVAYPTCACRVEVVGRRSASISGLARRALTLVLYNALNNAFTHGRPSQVAVQLRYAPDALIMVVEDDGAGMVVADERPGRRGLRDIRHLIEAHGGTLSIISSPQTGTKLTAVLPIPDERYHREQGEGDATVPKSQSAARRYPRAICDVASISDRSGGSRSTAPSPPGAGGG